MHVSIKSDALYIYIYIYIFMLIDIHSDIYILIYYVISNPEQAYFGPY